MAYFVLLHCLIYIRCDGRLFANSLCVVSRETYVYHQSVFSARTYDVFVSYCIVFHMSAFLVMLLRLQ